MEMNARHKVTTMSGMSTPFGCNGWDGRVFSKLAKCNYILHYLQRNGMAAA